MKIDAKKTINIDTTHVFWFRYIYHGTRFRLGMEFKIHFQFSAIKNRYFVARSNVGH